MNTSVNKILPANSIPLEIIGMILEPRLCREFLRIRISISGAKKNVQNCR